MTRLLQLVLWGAVLLALIFALWPQSSGGPGNSADKLQHFVAFFALSLLGRFAYPCIAPLRLFAGLVVFGGLIELAQIYPGIGRQGDWADLLADALGAWAGVLVAQRLRARRRRPSRVRGSGTR